MDGTANLVDREAMALRDDISSSVVTQRESAVELNWSPSVPRELTRTQNGLPVQWVDSAPAAPASSFSRSVSLIVKRLVDIAGAGAGLLFLAPLLIIVALLIKNTDKGPVFFRQSRVGLDGRVFQIMKFRSMYADRCDVSGISQTVADDKRVTPIGALIRKTSIDELPQLINVLRGDMSLVGPRPHVAGMLAGGMAYEDLVPHYGFRHHVRPGLTGWAQCQGLRGPTVDRSKALQRVGHDFAYVQNFSLWLDAKILVKTVASELLSSTAH
ncbi:sugar transferase [Devosia sp. Leaf420]|uniref:sugar transferase n=1 Tax=Devosia sp. Leaf420 TaxID=1736374 RepID=UPI000A9902C9|nr:sugar transferase [Devosia sp. Leaf420]